MPALKIYYDAKRNRYGKAYWTGTDFYLTQTPLQFMWGRVLPSCHPMRKNIACAFEESPNLVTKHELCNVLWGTEECIDENALQVTFTRLRKTLREFGLEERIETVRGQGYRLKEQVRL